MTQQIKSITSESLEAAYRALTPSQEGFTEDLMASNTIIPVLDLTASAEGTTTPQYLQTALAHGSQTSYNITTTSTTIANSPGFYRVYGQLNYSGNGASAGAGSVSVSDGLSSKLLWQVQGFNLSTTADVENNSNIDLIIFIAAGESILAGVSASGTQTMFVTVRQVADVNGNLVYPAGYTPQ